MSTKTLVVWENMAGLWVAGTSSYNNVEDTTPEKAIKLWKTQNKDRRVRIEIIE